MGLNTFSVFTALNVGHNLQKISTSIIQNMTALLFNLSIITNQKKIRVNKNYNYNEKYQENKTKQSLKCS